MKDVTNTPNAFYPNQYPRVLAVLGSQEIWIWAIPAEYGAQSDGQCRVTGEPLQVLRSFFPPDSKEDEAEFAEIADWLSSHEGSQISVYNRNSHDWHKPRAIARAWHRTGGTQTDNGIGQTTIGWHRAEL